MRSIIKKSILFTLASALVGALALLCVSCKKDQNNDNPSTEVILTLDKDRAPLILGDETVIKAFYTQVEGETLVWNSSDESVASVKDGKVASNHVGTAIISASYAGENAECEVVISDGNMLPVMIFEGLPEEENVTVGMLSQLNFIPSIKFNGKTFFDADVEYKVSDNAVGKIENGVFYPLKNGETLVEIIGNWRGLGGVYMRKSFRVNVIDELSVTVNGGRTSSIRLYTVGSHGGKTYETSSPFVVNVSENGQALKYNVSVIGGEGIINYNKENESVSAVGYGNAEIEISFIDEKGEEGTLNIPVSVLRPIAEYSKPIEYFSALDGDFPVEDVFGENAELTDAYYNGESLTVDNNKILGIPTIRTGMIERTVTIYSETVGYTVTFEVYTKILRSAADLLVFNSNRDGYFIMTNDIDCSGVATIANGGKFSGVFDGNGFSIKNAKFSATESGGGLFGIIGSNAVVRNFGVIDADLSAYSSAVLAGCSVTPYNAGALFENIYIKIAKVGSRPGALMWKRCPWDVFKNVLVDASCFSVSGYDKVYGIMFAFDAYAVAEDGKNWNKNVANISNVYVISEKNIPLSDNVEYNKTFPAKIYAVNDGIEENAATNEYVYTGVTRFDGLSALAKTVNKIGDDENYWTITESAVEWKGKLPEFEIIEYGKTVEFSAMDGDLPIDEIFGKNGVVLTEAYQGGTALSIEGNKVFGVATKNDGATETEIVIVSAFGKYRVKLNAYTKIIDEESDLSVFDVSSGIVNGYYVLGCDVICAGKIEWKNASADKDNNKYFNGIFDGKGHKIIGLRVGEKGLFGALGNAAIIRNVAFTASILSNEGDYKNTPFLAYESAADRNSGSKIENVYIQFADFRSIKGGDRGAGLLFGYNPNILIKDIIIEIKTTTFHTSPQFGYGALFVEDTTHGTAGNLQNIKVVSVIVPMAMKTDVALDTGIARYNWATYAGNDKDTAGKLEKDKYYYYDGITRYDDLAALSAVTTKVGSWKITGESVEWEEND